MTKNKLVKRNKNIIQTSYMKSTIFFSTHQNIETNIETKN